MFKKTLSANDTGKTSGNQAGIYVSKHNVNFFPKLGNTKNPYSWIKCIDQNGKVWDFCYIYYNNKHHFDHGTRDEYRITHITDFLKYFNATKGDTITICDKPKSVYYSIKVEKQPVVKNKVVHMTKTRVTHKFFPVGQGLFAVGSIDIGLKPPYRWIYDCGSSNANCLVTKAITDLKNDWGDSKIDLLTISHFHEDHISGVIELLNTIDTKTVMLPWVPLWQRLLIGFDKGLQSDDAEVQFYIDPLQYLIQEAGDGFEQVLFVMPSEGEGPTFSIEPTTARESPEDLEDPDKQFVPGESVSCDYLDLKNDHSQRRLRALQVGRTISLFGVWEFIPYNDPETRPFDLTDFKAKVKHHRQELLNGSDFERETAFEYLKNLYKKKYPPHTAMNNVSLMLYGGTIDRWRGHYHCEHRLDYLFNYCECWQEHETMASILLTGDGNLSNDSKWNTLEQYLDFRRAIQTSVFQVPHHGARANWYDGLAAAASPILSVFSSDPNHRNGHPHAEVRRDFSKHRTIQVDRHSNFSLEIYLETIT